MYKNRRSINLNIEVVKRIQLASKFFDVYNHELVDAALDYFGIPIVGTSASRKQALSRMNSHIRKVEAGEEDPMLIDYFKRGLANDN